MGEAAAQAAGGTPDAGSDPEDVVGALGLLRLAARGACLVGRSAKGYWVAPPFPGGGVYVAEDTQKLAEVIAGLLGGDPGAAS